jgi:hypothetical protein
MLREPELPAEAADLPPRFTPDTPEFAPGHVLQVVVTQHVLSLFGSDSPSADRQSEWG